MGTEPKILTTPMLERQRHICLSSTPEFWELPHASVWLQWDCQGAAVTSLPQDGHKTSTGRSDDWAKAERRTEAESSIPVLRLRFREVK